MKQIEYIIQHIKNLPTLTPIAERIIKMTNDINSSLTDMADIISLDQSISSRIIKLVNSAFLGFPRKISNIKQAVVILGFNTIKNLLLTLSVFATFKNKNDNGAHFNRTRFWEHSIACAVGSKILSQQTGFGVAEEVYFAGLFHDIGKIILDEFLHDEFCKIVDRSIEMNSSLRKAEKDVLGHDHSQIGLLLSNQWNFPDQIGYSIRYHHFPKLSKQYREVTAIIHLANHIVKSENMGYSGDKKTEKLSPYIWDTLNIDENGVKRLLPKIHHEFEKSIASLNLAE